MWDKLVRLETLSIIKRIENSKETQFCMITFEFADRSKYHELMIRLTVYSQLDSDLTYCL